MTLKNITLSAEEGLIHAARERARAERTTLNEQFRRWLKEYAGSQDEDKDISEVIKELQEHIHLHGPYDRDSMNER
jgi:hypothetical protein